MVSSVSRTGGEEKGLEGGEVGRKEGGGGGRVVPSSEWVVSNL